MQPRNVWLVGDWDEPCFAPALAWLETQASVDCFDSLSAAMDGLRSSSPPPDGLVLCASRPGRVAPEQVAQFSRREPLARVVQLLGSWCEGEERSGQPIAGVKRVYWHQWRSQLPLALGLEGTDAAEIYLPRTASDADWLEASLERRPTDRRLSVAVVTHRAATYDVLADALQAGGFTPVWQRPSQPLAATDAAAILCDGWLCDVELSTAAESRQPAKILLLDFPRLEDQQRAEAAGYFAVVSRPFLLAELWATLDAAIAASESAAPIPTAAKSSATEPTAAPSS